MTELAERRPKDPKPVSPSHWLACAIEIGITLTFVHERSIVGLILCAFYAWFSANWALVIGTKE